MSAKNPRSTSKMNGSSEGDEGELDVRALMQEVERAARDISALEGAGSPLQNHVPLPPPPRELDDDWDVWRNRPVQSHRGLLGLPIVLLKRASLLVLRLHDRELLKGQRAFNRAVRDELRQLREHVERVSMGRTESQDKEPK